MTATLRSVEEWRELRHEAFNELRQLLGIDLRPQEHPDPLEPGISWEQSIVRTKRSFAEFLERHADLLDRGGEPWVRTHSDRLREEADRLDQINKRAEREISPDRVEIRHGWLILALGLAFVWHAAKSLTKNNDPAAHIPVSPAGSSTNGG